MIIYTNRLEIVPGALQKAQGAVLKWLQRKYPAAGIEASDVAPSSRGVRKLGHNEYIDVVAEGGSNESPDLWLLRLVHPDRTVSGREWQTDVGLSRDLDGSRRFLSIVLRAEDKSPLVRAKIVPSRPGLVEDLVESGALDPATPGVGLRSIDSEDAARAFGYECADAARQHLLLLVSPELHSGRYLVDPEVLRSTTIGLADVVRIAPGVDPFLLTNVLGRRYASWNGAVAFIYPASQSLGSRLEWQNVPILAERLEAAMAAGDDPIRSVIFPRVAHWANHRLGPLVVTAEAILEARFKRRMEEARLVINEKGAEAAEKGAEAAAARSLLEGAGELEEKLSNSVRDLREASARVAQLEEEVGDLSAELKGKEEQFAVAIVEAGRRVPLPLGMNLATARIARGFLEGRPKLRVALELLCAASGERVLVLESALKSAEEVDKIDKPTVLWAFDMLATLVGDYYEALVAGQGDIAGARLFGAGGFASKENALGPHGRRLRSFSYHGKDVFMETHLKVGAKDTPNSCWRCHFFWDAETRRIVIGHCGKHLDFG